MKRPTRVDHAGVFFWSESRTEYAESWRRECSARVWQAALAVLAFVYAYDRGLIEAYNDLALCGRRGGPDA